MAKLEYDDETASLHTSLDDNPQKFYERLRDWAADDRRAVLLPPILRRHAERLVVPRPRGRPRLPQFFLAALAVDWAATPKPRASSLAERYKVAESTIWKWIGQARDRGLMSGDEPTDEARRLLGNDDARKTVEGWLRRGL